RPVFSSFPTRRSSDLDIVETNAPPLESLHRERLLQQVRSPEHAALIPAALPAHGEWVGSRLNVFVQAYNTRLVQRAELPKAYAEDRKSTRLNSSHLGI